MARYRGSSEGSGSRANEASAELAESSKVARLGQRPLLREGDVTDSPGCAPVAFGTAIRVHRFFEPPLNADQAVSLASQHSRFRGPPSGDPADQFDEWLRVGQRIMTGFHYRFPVHFGAIMGHKVAGKIVRTQLRRR
jgi:hypothetical protein